MADPTPITEPGIYDIPSDRYHGDCCSSPSISASMAWTLTEQCPAALWWGCYLNPDFRPENKKAFDLGTAAHTLLLEPETWNERAVLVDADDYKTKAAQAARDAAWAEDRVPLTGPQRDSIIAMRAALLSHPLARKAWENGAAEKSHLWRDQETGVWCKCRPDFRPDHGRWLVDYKTTTSARADEFQRRFYDLGHFARAAWYLEGVSETADITPEAYWFVVQEVRPPYLVAVYRASQRALEWGAMFNRRARHDFARCLSTGAWPGYNEDTASDIELPPWAEFRFEERRERKEFAPRPADDLKRLAAEGYAP